MSDESGVGYFELGLTAPVRPDGTVDERYTSDLQEIFSAWLGTQNGREFQEKFSNKANLDKMSRAIGALGGFWSVTAIDQAYADLKDAGSLLPTPPSAAELGQQRRREREAEFEEFHAAASTSEEKELASKSKKYDAWLRARIAGETAHPEQSPAARVADRSDKALVQFSNDYKKMLARDVASRMLDVEFREMVERAVEAGLL